MFILIILVDDQILIFLKKSKFSVSLYTKSYYQNIYFLKFLNVVLVYIFKANVRIYIQNFVFIRIRTIFCLIFLIFKVIY